MWLLLLRLLLLLLRLLLLLLLRLLLLLLLLWLLLWLRQTLSRRPRCWLVNSSRLRYGSRRGRVRRDGGSGGGRFGLENWALPPEPKSGQGHCDCDEQGWSKANALLVHEYSCAVRFFRLRALVVHQLQIRLAVILDVVVGASGAGQEAAEHEMARALVERARVPVGDVLCRTKNKSDDLYDYVCEKR